MPIVGTNDNRRIIHRFDVVEDITKEPLPSITAIDSTLDDLPPAFGTGVVISPNYVLTAAHVLYDKSIADPDFNDELRVSSSNQQKELNNREIGANGDPGGNVDTNTEPFLLFRDQFIPAPANTPEENNFDIGLIELNNTDLISDAPPIGLIAFVDPLTLEESSFRFPIQTAGYPVDNVANTFPPATRDNKGILDQQNEDDDNIRTPAELDNLDDFSVRARDLVLAPGILDANGNETTGRILRASEREGERRILYSDNIDTVAGQSGSPVWGFLPEEDGSEPIPRVFAVHSRGVGMLNAGTLIDKEAYDLIIDEIEGDGDPDELPENAIIGSNPRDEFTKPSNDGNDSIEGSYRKELILGLTGDDTIFGMGAIDRLEGNEGDDILNGGEGGDSLDGGRGSDFLEGEDGDDFLAGGEGEDSLSGGEGDDFLAGGEGDDSLDGGEGDDVLEGGAGDDLIDGGTNPLLSLNPLDIFGSDVAVYSANMSEYDINTQTSGGVIGSLIGEQITVITHLNNGIDGQDTLTNVEFLRFADGTVPIHSDDDDDPDGQLSFIGGSGKDNLFGNTLSNFIFGDDGNDRLEGREGNDTLEGGFGFDTLKGDDDDDSLIGGGFRDTLIGGGGNDIIEGDEGHDLIYGGDGIDMIYGGEQNDTISGGNQRDVIVGNDGNDSLVGGNDSDSIFGKMDNDILKGQDGDDSLYGDDGVDRLEGGSDNDVLGGGSDNDLLFGQDGNDSLDGGSENDRLEGGVGNDTLTGGSGRDNFVFDRLRNETDIINDFSPADDTMSFRAAGFRGISTTGMLDSQMLTIGTDATSRIHRFIYNPGSGDLFYDLDRSRNRPPLLIAELDPGLALTNTDFNIF